MKYSVITFGCRVNQADSLGFEEDLLAGGGVAVEPRDADLVIVNTCSVTSTADQGARQTIRRIARDNPSARIVVTGCYATRRPDEISALPNVARIVPNDDKPKLVRVLAVGADPCVGPGADTRVRPYQTADLTTAVRFGDGEGSCGAAIAPGVAGRTAYTLRVQTGCAEACAYCIIPTTRGRPRSISPDEVLREVERVSAAGFKEVALTGVHLGSYGRDLAPASSLLALLWSAKALAERHDLLFRISSLEPMDCSREIVALVATARCFAPHFHLPLQHASNRVLTAMRRPYTIEYYAGLVDHIRARMPHASIGSDVIVGFPEETDRDFEELVTYLERSPLSHIHVFPYSDRPGTAASAKNAKVPGAVIRQRAQHVRDIAAALTKRFRDAQIGTVRPALTIEDGSLAVTDNYLKLRIVPARPRNDWVRVRVVSHHGGELLPG